MTTWKSSDPTTLPKRTIPRPPKALGEQGRALWRKVVGVYELRADELAALEGACRTRDELVRMEEALAGITDVVVEGSKGQLRAHPLFAEVRYHRRTLALQLAACGLAEVDGEVVGMDRSNAGRALARTRWGRYGA